MKLLTKMNLKTAVATLQELVSHRSIVLLAPSEHVAKTPLHVSRIDYFSNRAYRCVLGRIDSRGIWESIRAPVSEVTIEFKYREADAVVEAANFQEVQRAVARFIDAKNAGRRPPPSFLGLPGLGWRETRSR